MGFSKAWPSGTNPTGGGLELFLGLGGIERTDSVVLRIWLPPSGRPVDRSELSRGQKFGHPVRC